MANYYQKFSAKIKYQTAHIKMSSDCQSPGSLFDEAVGIVFNEHGEAHVRALFEKTMETKVRFHKQYQEEQAKKEKQNAG